MNELNFSEIAKLNERYNKDPRSRIFVQLADCYRKNSMIDEALEVLNKGLQYHPQYPLAYLVLGKCYFDKRAHIQAREAFEKTLALDPQNIVALRILAKTCEILKDEKGQINAYKSIIGIDPLDMNAKEKLSMLEALQRKEPLYTVAMAEEYEKQGNLEESLKIYENLLYTDPSDLILKQKVAELKKALTEKKARIEAAKIEEMQVEPVFKSTDLPEEGRIEKGDEPETQEPRQIAAPTAEEGIQSLEDFLVEELEQAAEKAAKPAEETKPREEPSAPEEKTPAPRPALFADVDSRLDQPVQEESKPAVSDEKQDETDQAVELSFGDIMLDNETPSAKVSEPTEKEAILPTVAEQPAEPEQSILPEAEAEHEPVSEPRTEEPPPEAQPQIGDEKPDEKKEEPKKPKEEDFKSFQEWLSGLLK
jgi:tetratricopeptide (TPR) repeat protein